MSVAAPSCSAAEGKSNAIRAGRRRALNLVALALGTLLALPAAAAVLDDVRPHEAAEDQGAPTWILLGKRGVPVPALAEVRLCGNGSWRNPYRSKVASAVNVYGIAERLDQVEFGSCDLAVFSRQEMAELGAYANRYDRYLLDDEAILPFP